MIRIPRDELLVILCVLPTLSVIGWLGGVHFGGAQIGFLVVGVVTVAGLFYLMRKEHG